MKSSFAIGILLLLLGTVILAWPVISYTTSDTIIDLGPVEVTSEEREHVALPPVLGGALVAAGMVLVVLKFIRADDTPRA
jgi:hypothetical protein